MDDGAVARSIGPGFMDVIAEYGKKDAHVGDDELDWIPYVVPNAYWKPLRFDLSTGRMYAPLWFKAPGQIGRHQHQGTVMAFVQEGSWYYKEYDWVARPGDLVCESPGGIHTLCSDTGTKSFFVIDGPIDFFGDDGGFIGSQNIFWFIQAYEEHCRATGRPVNRKVFF